MYSDKENVNTLTALLVAHGVEKAVVCPGSRNAPIVHNLNECGQMECFPVTDERSAGFYALGLCLQTGKPVVVCVTSGSALLNVAPAVVEAFYRHMPLIVVSADRPAAWIGQLDGQTMVQPGALAGYVRTAVTLPEPNAPTARWHCNRLANEALCLATLGGRGGPVHINIPISEPLFNFTVKELPQERVIRLMRPTFKLEPQHDLWAVLLGAKKPMVVVGQMACGAIAESTMQRLAESFVVVSEPLGHSRGAVHFDEVVLRCANAEALMPDFVLYIGDTLVSKRMRRFLRQAKAPACLLTPDASTLADPLMSLTQVVEYCGNDCLNALLADLADSRSTSPKCDPADSRNISPKCDPSFLALWREALAEASSRACDYEPPYSQMAAVKYFEEQLDDIGYAFHTHYANSSEVRLANIYSRHYVWCNRGINGIEGSLSTVAGFSLATTDRVFCIIGDLSFFYDQNALWNTRLRGNLRIVLLNNGEGGIFRQLHGLSASPAARDYVAGAHSTTAQGICSQNDIGYIRATNMAEMQMGMVTLLTRDASRPMVLEVFTNADADAKAMQEYLEYPKH